MQILVSDQNTILTIWFQLLYFLTVSTFWFCFILVSSVIVTIRKVLFCQKIQFWQNFTILSGNQSCQQLKSANPQHFHEFFTQNFFTIFLVKSKLSTAKKSKAATFSRVFTQNNLTIFLGKWRFRTVWQCCIKATQKILVRFLLF